MTIFGITQLNLFELKHQKWSDGERKFLNIFGKLKTDW